MNDLFEITEKERLSRAKARGAPPSISTVQTGAHTSL